MSSSIILVLPSFSVIFNHGLLFVAATDDMELMEHVLLMSLASGRDPWPIQDCTRLSGAVLQRPRMAALMAANALHVFWGSSKAFSTNLPTTFLFLVCLPCLGTVSAVLLACLTLDHVTITTNESTCKFAFASVLLSVPICFDSLYAFPVLLRVCSELQSFSFANMPTHLLALLQ